MHICKYVQSLIIIIIIQRVLVTSVTIIRMCHNKNTIIMQIIVQKCVIELQDITLYFFCSLPVDSHRGDQNMWVKNKIS